MHVLSVGVLTLDFTLTRSIDQAQCQGHGQFDSGYLGIGDDNENLTIDIKYLFMYGLLIGIPTFHIDPI